MAPRKRAASRRGSEGSKGNVKVICRGGGGGKVSGGSRKSFASSGNGDEIRGSVGTRTSANTAPFNYGAAVGNLARWGVKAVEAEYRESFVGVDAENCHDALKAFLALVSPSERTTATTEAYAKRLLAKLDASYVNEKDFNVQLFEAIGECIREVAMKRRTSPFHVRITENAVVLEPKHPVKAKARVGDEVKTLEYATALVREPKLPPADASYILMKPVWMDHAWVSLERFEGEEGWRVRNVLAVVDLKMEGNVVRGLEKNSKGNVDFKRLRPLKPSQHGPLAQVIVYAIAHALRGNAALGALPENLPFAVLSCHKSLTKGEKEPETRLPNGWIHGNLVAPVVCGCSYSFNVDAYGPSVRKNDGGKSSSSRSALSAYLHVMGYGLGLSKGWLEKLATEKGSSTMPARVATAPMATADSATLAAAPAVVSATATARASAAEMVDSVENSHRELPPPHRISGHVLRFGTAEPLSMGEKEIPNVLVATPVSKYGVNGMRVSQGELFQATINLDELYRATVSRVRVFWCRDEYDNNEQPMLIKVTSASCFNLLIPKGDAYLYNLKMKHWKADDEVRRLLSQSLYGVYVTPGESGLVQLLPDLKKEGFDDLSLHKWLEGGRDWRLLWDAFAGLVKEVLIPLANDEIVHADIRAGYDVTSNVLYSSTAGTMRMIDLDSLCYYGKLSGLSDVEDERYINADYLPSELDSALGFVLGQVICVAEAWHGKIVDAKVKANVMIDGVGQADLEGVVGGQVDVAQIEAALEHYKNKLGSILGNDATS